MSEIEALTRVCEIGLSNGRRVRGFLHGDSVQWQFTSREGMGTELALSREAVLAMMSIFQSLLMPEGEWARIAVVLNQPPFYRGNEWGTTPQQSPEKTQSGVEIQNQHSGDGSEAEGG